LKDIGILNIYSITVVRVVIFNCFVFLYIFKSFSYIHFENYHMQLKDFVKKIISTMIPFGVHFNNSQFKLHTMCFIILNYRLAAFKIYFSFASLLNLFFIGPKTFEADICFFFCMKLYYSFNVLMRPLKIIINACKLKLIYVSDCKFLTTQIFFWQQKKLWHFNLQR
jgi:hypothetical protein